MTTPAPHRHDPAFPAGHRVFSRGKELVFGRDIEALQSADHLLGDAAALRDRLADDGYLLLRGFHPRDEVMAARADLIAALRAGGRLAEGSAGDDGLPSAERAQWVDWPQAEIARWPRYQALVNSPRLMGFFSRLLGGEAMTLDHKWIRAVGPGSPGTNAHCDIVYMGEGTRNLFTVWTPLGDISLEMGTLMICPGAHRDRRLTDTYGRTNAHAGSPGPFCDDPIATAAVVGSPWRTTTFAAGDILVFGMYTMHASLENRSDRFRLSTDTRYQLASEPVDQRHMGDDINQKLHPRLDTEWLKEHGQHLLEAARRG
jgi:ectoine hydroxylase-related dioxygenase (phytanoyl-CoA dioxygenase family)